MLSGELSCLLTGLAEITLLGKHAGQHFSSFYVSSCRVTVVCLRIHIDDGWMTCDLTSFLTVFQSYQDDVRMIMKGCVQWNSVYGREDFTSSEDGTQSARSVGQRLTH